MKAGDLLQTGRLKPSTFLSDPHPIPVTHSLSFTPLASGERSFQPSMANGAAQGALCSFTWHSRALGARGGVGTGHLLENPIWGGCSAEALDVTPRRTQGV